MMLLILAAITFGGHDLQARPPVPIEEPVLMLTHTRHGTAASIESADECRNTQEAIAAARLTGQHVMLMIEDGPDVQVVDVECISDVEIK